MSKSRSIETKIRMSQSFSALSYRQRDLWHGLIVAADDQGRLPGHPAAVRSLVWPYDDVSLADLTNDLDALQATGKILLYEIDGSKYIQIVNWWKYQKMQWAGESNYPPPDGWIDRKRYHGKGRKIVTENWDTPGGFALLINKSLLNDNDKDNDNDNASQQSKTTKVDDKGSQNVYSHYQNEIGMLSPGIADLLDNAVSEYGEEWVSESIQEAAKNNVRKWSYIDAILKNWHTNGRAKKNTKQSQSVGGSLIE